MSSKNKDSHIKKYIEMVNLTYLQAKKSQVNYLAE